MKTVRLLAPLCACLLAATCGASILVSEKFSADPSADGWQNHGDTNLFRWDAAGHDLLVTWDSSRPDSYFCHPLGTTVTKTNDFLVEFDLRLSDIAIGVNPAKPYSFEIAIGLINTNIAFSSGISRGAGVAPDLVELDYFPNDVNNYGATISTLFISAANNYSAGGFTDPLELQTNVIYHAAMSYTAADQHLRTKITANGAPFGPVEDAYLTAGFDDFAVNAISVSSYSDNGQTPGYEGSILAHGAVDNLLFASPLPVRSVDILPAGAVRLNSATNWTYTLECTTNFISWTPAAPTVAGNGANILIQPTNTPQSCLFYRVRADAP